MKKRAFVLLSGGIDSTTCLYQAHKDYKGEVEAIGIDYGQRHIRELEMAKRVCDKLGVKQTTLSVGDLLSGKEVLLSRDSVDHREMVHKSYDELAGVSPSFVPFRNGLMLSAITAYTQKYANAQIEERSLELYQGQLESFKEEARMAATQEAKDLCAIYYGAHAEDAANWAYPDCTPEFNGAMANAIYIGSYNTIRLVTPLQWLKKYEIIWRGTYLGVPYSLTWSCYDTYDKHCGKCPTCLARKEAFKLADVADPTEYLALGNARTR